MFKFILRYFHDIEIAVESIISNKLKSMLTALGIIFGVAAVIAMPSVKRISPEIAFNSTAMMSGVKYTAKLVGVSNDYFYLYNLPLVAGTFFNNYQEENGIQVCIIGANIRAKFFSQIDPIGP